MSPRKSKLVRTRTAHFRDNFRHPIFRSEASCHRLEDFRLVSVMNASRSAAGRTLKRRPSGDATDLDSIGRHLKGAVGAKSTRRIYRALNSGDFVLVRWPIEARGSCFPRDGNDRSCSMGTRGQRKNVLLVSPSTTAFVRANVGAPMAGREGTEAAMRGKSPDGGRGAL